MVPPIMTFSSTEASPTRRGVWNVRAMRMRARACADERWQHRAVELRGAALRRVVAGDHVQRRGLAAAVRADQPVHLAGADRQVEAVDRAHAAEAQRHLLECQRARLAVLPEQARQQIGARDDRAIALKRTAVLEIEKLGDAARHRQHDDEQQHRIEEGRPRDQRRGELRQHGQQNRAEQRPEDRAASADQDRR